MKVSLHVSIFVLDACGAFTTLTIESVPSYGNLVQGSRLRPSGTTALIVRVSHFFGVVHPRQVLLLDMLNECNPMWLTVCGINNNLLWRHKLTTIKKGYQWKMALLDYNKSESMV
jgi:hypothetical protein